jgi:YidC/Oxa1 family membrane protein insertase
LIPIIAQGLLGIEHFTPPWDIFFLPLFNLLILFYRLLVSDFALAIIVFTVVIRTVLAPLFVRQIRSQKEMQRMQPLIREVQRKHKGNRVKIQEETMALYKEHGVNPAAGCLPVVVQLPILFALYQALIRASNVVTLAADKVSSPDFAKLKAALPGISSIDATHFRAPIDGACNLPQFSIPDFTHFLPLNCQLISPLQLHEPIITKIGWLGGLDLAQIDHVFSVVIPGVGFPLSFLAVIAAVLQFVQVKMTSPLPNPDDPTSSLTSSMTYTFPLLTVVWGGIFPSGLILYWIVYTGYLVAHQFLIMGWGNLFPILGWSPPFAPAPATKLAAGQRRQLAPVREEVAVPARQSNPRPDRANSSAGRSANRRSGGRRARGRKR